MIKRFKPGKKKCKAEGCDNSFEKNIHQPFQEWCSPECAVKIWNSKKSKKEKKDWSEKKKTIQNNLKTLGDHEKDAKVPFQKWIRQRDENQPCISCDSNDSTLFDGGHYLKAELYTGLIFDERNCHKQCRKCNRYLNGNEINYRIGLIKRYGEEYVLSLEKNKDDFRVYIFSKEELILIKKKYTQLIKNGTI